MKTDKDKLWSAYLDDQLDAKESAEFDGSLSLNEKDRLTKEVHWESCLATALADKSDCPDAVWKRVRSEVLKKERTHHSSRSVLFAPSLLKVAALAASVLVAFLLLHEAGRPEHDDDCLSMPLNVEAMTAHLDVSGDLDSVRQFLKEHDVGISLQATSTIQMPAGHHATLLGARASRSDGETVVELLYECCGKPIKMVIARNGTRMADRIRDSVSEDIVQITRQIGDFQVALVGLHEGTALMQVLTKIS